ncbi:hypothetical protein LJ753_10960 [Arthrobacter sp. zg-Y20]|uniref:DUF7341 domain-containing protein n=1 Tax=unclassified Arthrobacter TaxID=235627 RepID=UPI001D134655|nr:MULTISPECIES: hypothetical protein [unclassified Arthrobacter]MCC3276389.1 hypothetical protein [Arthrobacter sp. zg-Y20]MDK1316548.1 hypothetical protein [Arthrobacter sp. zg.Y20]WIB06588.1 hypothetical protein QNO06_02260 [Arthrobacter sp. zg-Y20]
MAHLQDELIQAVNTLTRSTPHGMNREREDGTAYIHFLLEEPLLSQLRAAIRPGMEQGGGASGGRPAPLAVNALDLYLDIERTTHTFYWLHYSPGGDRQSLEAMIQSWAATASAKEQTTKEALKMIGGWVTRIRALFDPGKSIELQGACPAEGCGARYYCQEDDGEKIRKPALTAHPAAARPFAVCGACGARWEGELQLNVLATLMQTAELPAT